MEGFLISVPSSLSLKNSGETLRFRFKIKIQLKQKIKLVSCNSSPLVVHRQRGDMGCRAMGSSAGLWEETHSWHAFLIPLFLVTGRKRTVCTSCRRTGHNGSHGITIVDLDQSVYILEKSCWEHTLEVISKTSTMSRRNDVSATLKPILKTLKHVASKHCRNSLARR